VGDAAARLRDGWTVDDLDIDRDLDQVMAVDAASFPNPWTRGMFLHEAQDPEFRKLLVLRAPDRAVAGYCALWIVAGELHVNNIAVGPAWRGRGLGAALLGAALRHGAARGATRATLEVRASKTAALALYRRFGFVEAGRRPGYYTNPVDDALILWKDRIDTSP
jgi:ribosomal-protein-alanine N-acetyltransferase